MKCAKCGKELTALNHHFIPGDGRTKEGFRLCLECVRTEKIVTLI